MTTQAVWGLEGVVRKLAAIALAVCAACGGPPRVPEPVIEQRQRLIQADLDEGRTTEAWKRYQELVNSTGRPVFPDMLAAIAAATLTQGLVHNEPAARVAALAALQYADAVFAADAAAARLRDPELAVRTAAADALRRAGRLEMIALIRPQLKTEPPGGLQVIETQLLQEYERLHTHVRWALAELGDDSLPIGPLVDSMSSADPAIRAAAARALGALGKRNALPSLRYGLNDDIEWQVNRASAEALLNLDERAPAAQYAESAAGSIEPRRVVWALDVRRRHGIGPTPDWILEVASYRREPAIRRKAAEVLGRLNVARAEPRLNEMLNQFEARVRAAAAYALVLLGRPSHTEKIVEAAADDDPAVRQQALGYLAELDQARFRQAISSALNDPEPAVRFAAVLAYAPSNERLPDQQIPRLAALADLGTKLDDGDDSVRFTAAALIRRLWPRRAGQEQNQ